MDQSRKRSTGSSPLTRGKRWVFPGADSGHGLIPAHAGKTVRLTSRRRQPRAHPRSRGENLIGYSITQKHLGSSPLTRGKPRRERQTEEEARLIPAHAGKTRVVDEGVDNGRAHPRSRGENRRWNLIQAFARGSSPLTRGKQFQRVREFLGRGLIPAHAGKTSAMTSPIG